MANSVERNSKHASPSPSPCPQCPEESCCAAYNEALAAYFKSVNTLLVNGINAISVADGEDAADRLVFLKASYDNINDIILFAFGRAQEEECDAACCISTAETIRSLGVSAFTTLVAVASNPLYTTGDDGTLNEFFTNIQEQLTNALNQLYSNIGCPDEEPTPPEPCYRQPDNTCYNCYVPNYKLHCPVTYCKPIGKCVQAESSSTQSESESSSSSHHKKQHKKKHQKKHKKEEKKENWLKPKDDDSSSSSSDSDSSAFERLKKKLEQKKPAPKAVEVKGHKEKKADLYEFESSKKGVSIDASFKKAAKKPAKDFYEFSYDEIHW